MYNMLSRSGIGRSVRKYLPLLCLVLLFAACGADTTATTPTPTATAAPTPTPTATLAPTPTATPASSNSTTAVSITGSAGSYAFSPAILHISVGATVTWTNRTRTLHTVTSNSGVFDTGTDKALDAGQSFSFTFTKAGTFPYHCDFHIIMQATIVVS